PSTAVSVSVCTCGRPGPPPGQPGAAAERTTNPLSTNRPTPVALPVPCVSTVVGLVHAGVPELRALNGTSWPAAVGGGGQGTAIATDATRRITSRAPRLAGRCGSNAIGVVVFMSPLRGVGYCSRVRASGRPVSARFQPRNRVSVRPGREADGLPDPGTP